MGPARSGTEWIVDAFGCEPSLLRSQAVLEEVFRGAIADLELRPIGETVWHAFPGAGGITGLALLCESHLACHTFPEDGFAAFNLYCCRPREPWAWEKRLAEHLQAKTVIVRRVERGGDPGAAGA